MVEAESPHSERTMPLNNKKTNQTSFVCEYLSFSSLIEIPMRF